jgi:hypothetical protein
MLRQGNPRLLAAIEPPLDQSFQACVGILNALRSAVAQPCRGPTKQCRRDECDWVEVLSPW